jgi:hypothetical protein
MDPDDEEDRPVAHGYVSSEITALEQKRRDDLEHDLRSKIDSQLGWLPEADQAYAAFLKAGMNQKEAARAMGESVVTSRKREKRIRRATAGLLSRIDGCADEFNLLEWPSLGLQPDGTYNLNGAADEPENSIADRH